MPRLHFPWHDSIPEPEPDPEPTPPDETGAVARWPEPEQPPDPASTFGQPAPPAQPLEPPPPLARCLCCGAPVLGGREFCAAHDSLATLSEAQMEDLLTLAADVFCGDVSDWLPHPGDGMSINHSRMLRFGPPTRGGVKRVRPWQLDLAEINLMAGWTLESWGWEG